MRPLFNGGTLSGLDATFAYGEHNMPWVSGSLDALGARRCDRFRSLARLRVAVAVAALALVCCKSEPRHQVTGTSSASAQPTAERPTPEFVPLVRLLSSPTSVEGTLVGVQGFVAYDFEGTAVYLSQDDYLNGLSDNALWLQFARDDDKVATDDHEYCLVVGTFHSSPHGHMGVFSGTILVEAVRGCREPVHPRQQANTNPTRH
jgi:hypothetical protein